MGCVELARAFLAYCEEHEDMRFWQALLAFTGEPYIWAGRPGEEKDTFYRAGLRK